MRVPEFERWETPAAEGSGDPSLSVLDLARVQSADMLNDSDQRLCRNPL